MTVDGDPGTRRTPAWAYRPSAGRGPGGGSPSARRLRGLRYGIGAGVTLVGALVAGLLTVHILFVVFEANPDNDMVAFFRHAADFLAGAFTDLFVPQSPKDAVAANYGLAAASYLLVGLGVGAKLRS